MRIGVFVPNWVGDVVMATPALRALRRLAGSVGGSGRLVGVMRPYVSDVLAGLDWLDETICYAKGSEDPALQWPNVRARLRTAELDRVVLLTNSLRTAWMAYQSGARERIGMAANLRSPLLTVRVFPPRRRGRRVTLPTINGYLQVAQAAGASIDNVRLQLATTDDDERAADATWNRLSLPATRRVAVLNTGGAFGAAKDWPGDRFGQLARRLADADWHVLVNCGPKERTAAERVVQLADHPHVVSLSAEPDLPMGLTKACIRRAGLLVTTDSGPRFFGVAFGVPTVALFGPTSTEFTRTYDGVETCISLGLDCQPCMARSCPLVHHRCMRDLAVDRVYAAAEALVALQAGRGATHPRAA